MTVGLGRVVVNQASLAPTVPQTSAPPHPAADLTEPARQDTLAQPSLPPPMPVSAMTAGPVISVNTIPVNNWAKPAPDAGLVWQRRLLRRSANAMEDFQGIIVKYRAMECVGGVIPMDVRPIYRGW